MNMEIKSRLGEALAARIEALAVEANALSAADRADECHHKKAARNVYGIFTQLLQSAKDASDYEKFFETIPENWHSARALAASHGDFARVAMEDVKLNALGEIKALYDAMKAGEPHA